jgi:hypothetical protein
VVVVVVVVVAAVAVVVVVVVVVAVVAAAAAAAAAVVVVVVMMMMMMMMSIGLCIRQTSGSKHCAETDYFRDTQTKPCSRQKLQCRPRRYSVIFSNCIGMYSAQKVL